MPRAGFAGGWLLELAWDEDGLSAGLAKDGAARRRFPFAIDAEGRLVSRALGTRIDPDCTEPRALEHVLRRVVRAALR